MKGAQGPAEIYDGTRAHERSSAGFIIYREAYYLGALSLDLLYPRPGENLCAGHDRTFRGEDDEAKGSVPHSSMLTAPTISFVKPGSKAATSCAFKRTCCFPPFMAEKLS